MKIIIKTLFFTLGLVLFFNLFRLSPINAATYGNCSYGASKYGNEECPTNSSGSSNNNSSSSSGCNNTPPSSAPDLFQINTTNTTATLFLAAAGGKYNNYAFAYGTKAQADMYGGGFNLENARTAISVTINSLSPNTTYYFKIRAGNGCTGGPWSKVLAARTTNSKTKIAKYYKNTISAVVSTVGQIIKKDKTANATAVPNVGAAVPTNNAPAPQSDTNTTQAQSSKPGFFKSIFSSIKKLF